LGIDCLAEDLLHSIEFEVHRLAPSGARFEGRDAHIDEFAFEMAATGEKNFRNEV
jgi:hypothetical protein